MRNHRRLAVAVLALLGVAPMAQAWGPLGHSVVAELAQRHLSPAAETEVEHLLSLEHKTRLAEVASWPDEIRNDPAQDALWKQTRSLHYVDFGNDKCNYEPPRDCPDGQCVVAAIDHYAEILADKKQSDETRLQALKFVVHFIGDEHQPLHAGSRDDKGGNQYQVQMDGKGTNLHHVWDSGLLLTHSHDWQAYADELDKRGQVKLPAPIAPLDNPYAQWAEESCLATAQPGFYPNSHKIDDAYVKAELPLAEERLRIAGRRLANVLNMALGK
ncbi:S1/P1 nuclease [Dyella sp.]|uniref:S1/P1 nuclease n=1 Tax=Dyella sp. TaxID=1869338 RepID=UPI002ED52E9F